VSLMVDRTWAAWGLSASDASRVGLLGSPRGLRGATVRALLGGRSRA
jgi:hypothetical protein